LIEEDRRRLAYIVTSIDLIEQRVRGGRTPFMRDVDIQDAVLWRLQTLAEAAGKLSPAVQSRHPHVRWRAIYGFRNVAAHGYLELNLDVVWEILQVHLPLLRRVAEAELAS
jgi:uncharacterized protein with HEPN domain